MTPPDLPLDGGALDMTLGELLDAIMRNRWAGTNILRGQLPRAVTLETLPTASSDLRHVVVVIPGGAGVADAAYVCIKNATDTYEWVKFSSPDTLVDLTVTGELAHSGSTLGFFGATPTTKPGATAEMKGALAGLGLLTDGGATNLNLDGGDITCDDIDAGQVTSSQGVLITAGGLLHEAGFLAFWNGTGHSSKPTLTGTYTGTLAQLQTAFHNLTQLLAQYGHFTDSTS